jgi:hypothetical protein
VKTVYLLMLWLNGSWTPLLYEAYESREQCELRAVALNQAHPYGFAACPRLEIIRAR